MGDPVSWPERGVVLRDRVLALLDEWRSAHELAGLLEIECRKGDTNRTDLSRVLAALEVCGLVDSEMRLAPPGCQLSQKFYRRRAADVARWGGLTAERRRALASAFGDDVFLLRDNARRGFSGKLEEEPAIRQHVEDLEILIRLLEAG